MYCTTIAKIDALTNVWAGFNMNSQIILEGTLIEECDSYGVRFEPCEKGELRVHQIDWKGYTVFIQYRRIS